MPTDLISRGRGCRLAIVVHVMLMVLCALMTLGDGLHPSGYRAFHSTQPWVYPTDAIVTWLGVMFAEGLFGCWVLQARSKVSIGARALLLGGTMFVILMGLAPLAMHGGTPIIEHLTWLFFASCWLIAFALGSFVVAMVRRYREQMTVHGP